MAGKKKEKIQVSKIEVDQSCRIEELTRNTILGLANKEVDFTAVVSKKTKRALYEEFRRRGKPKKFAPYVFAQAISETLNTAPFRISDLIIDIEYPGYEQEILKIIKKQHPEINIYFTTVGKKSYAHYAAYGVHLERKEANCFISFKKFAKII